MKTIFVLAALMMLTACPGKSNLPQGVTTTTLAEVTTTTLAEIVQPEPVKPTTTTLAEVTPVTQPEVTTTTLKPVPQHCASYQWLPVLVVISPCMPSPSCTAANVGDILENVCNSGNNQTCECVPQAKSKKIKK